jgi:hypothetical protein
MAYSWGSDPDATTEPLAAGVADGQPPPVRARRIRLLTTRGALDVAVCGLCAALTVADGAHRHELHHHALEERQ